MDSWEEENKIKNCCPVCGDKFEDDEITDEPFDCKGCNDSFSKNLTKGDLIGCWDDYLYVT